MTSSTGLDLKMIKFPLAFVLFVTSGFLASAQVEDRHHPRVLIPRKASTAHENAEHWRKIGQEEITRTFETLNSVNTNLAKNVIIFVGDGMSLPTLTASRIYKAQYEGRSQRKEVNGEETLLTFEQFPHAAFSKTYCVDAQTPDSAATANAMFRGVKTNHYTMGFDNSVQLGNVSSEEYATKVTSILEWAQDAGKDTGFVTTTRLSHATPAALYAYSADRNWECNKKFANGSIDSKDISWQLIHANPGRRIKVALGGGKASFYPEKLTSSDVNWSCLRKDNINLIEDFQNKTKDPEFAGKKVKVVENRGQLNSVKPEEVDYLMGIFNWGYMKYEHQREVDAAKPEAEPSITEMTEAAIKILQKSENGFFLMVEGGKIDVAHHDGWANTAMHETMAFDRAIARALEMVNTDETLIIVTADHGHTMSMSGYQTRGVDIRGIVDNDLALDNKTINILNYANGPGFYDHLSGDDNNNVTRVNLTSDMSDEFEFHQPSSAPFKSETHSGSDVGIFAKGPFSHLFRSVHEQNYIAYVMAYSACIGPYRDNCHKSDSSSATSLTITTAAPAFIISLLLSMLSRK